MRTAETSPEKQPQAARTFEVFVRLDRSRLLPELSVELKLAGFQWVPAR
jgi:hypothetical protein